MKARTMIYLEAQQLKALRSKAKAEGVSLAEVIRRLVAAHLGGGQPPRPVPHVAYAKLVALGSSGHTDVSERHDSYLADALRRDHVG